MPLRLFLALAWAIPMLTAAQTSAPRLSARPASEVTVGIGNGVLQLKRGVGLGAQLGYGLRFTPRWSARLLFEYASAEEPDDVIPQLVYAASGVEPFSRSFAYRLSVFHHFPIRGPFDVQLGLGVQGRRFLNETLTEYVGTDENFPRDLSNFVSARIGQQDIEQSSLVPELAFRYEALPGLRVGPYASLEVALLNSRGSGVRTSYVRVREDGTFRGLTNDFYDFNEAQHVISYGLRASYSWR